MNKRKIVITIGTLASLVVIALIINYITKPKIMAQSYEKPVAIGNLEAQYDVIVIGGEPEGVAAAVMAARSGSKTLLIEKREDLGGLFTFGMLNFLDIPKSKSTRQISRGIYKEWHALVGKDNAFNIEDAKAAFKQLVFAEENLTLSVSTTVEEILLTGNTLTGVKVKNANGTYIVKGKAFIDATQDADIAVMANVPYFVGGKDIGIEDKKMAVTLMLHLKNVDWKKVKETAKSEKFGQAEVKKSVAWGFTKLHDLYTPVEENTRLRGLNLVKEGDDYYINALQIFDVDGLSETAKAEAIEKGKRETKPIVDYLRKEFGGFENAEIAGYPTELYVRETRHILAEYQLPMSDVWKNSDHWDNIGYGAYPVDVQAQTPHDYGYVISTPSQYAIPFRSLVPLKIDGLLVVGRSAGYSSLAAGSTRIVPTGMVTGDAAGTAASLAIKEGVTFRELSKDEALIEQLRANLKHQGAFVKQVEASYPYEDEWFDQSVQTLINYGLVIGGYDNDLMVEKPVTTHNFMNMLMGSVNRIQTEKAIERSEQLQTVYNEIFYKENEPLDLNKASAIVAGIFLDQPADERNWTSLIEAGIISKSTSENIDSANHHLVAKEMYAICADVIGFLSL
ncbi:FAD-dependent oxidoreductase [Lysinibacillus sp. 2017]|uniref:FAD-dependent oxidoreductase n=1 Tax=unclassified Lysinibacillus TaxID=2636778 RepID=UPI000D529D60|nr:MULTISPECIES: FAD-dependent oxidoreductase [unclassified Lysinibacillus]AWE06336.1 FAD-dependent oxidoreductase [Lysinibacillus sp. 2017]TGN34987.1 FAD-dependent oxidoreductase [Lysinibacillus sp. S2017]